MSGPEIHVRKVENLSSKPFSRLCYLHLLNRTQRCPSEADEEAAMNVWLTAFKDGMSAYHLQLIVSPDLLVARDVFSRALSTGDEQFLRRFVYLTLIAGFQGGEVYFASCRDTPVAGVALWYPPGCAMLDT